MEHKSFAFNMAELKAAEDGWWVAGWASTFGGDPDSYSDIITKGAFTKSLAKRPDVPLLWQHDQTEPIGSVLTLTEEDQGLFGRWSLVDTDTGIKAHKLLEKKLIKAMSIGFMAVDYEYREDGVRVLKEIDLFEVSLVTLPANQAAVLTSFKSQIRTDIPLDQLLANAATYLDVATSEAKATHERRMADSGRQLSEKSREAAQRLIGKVEACRESLAALVTPPDAEAKAADLQAHGLEAIDLHSAELRQRRARIAYLAQKGRIPA